MSEYDDLGERERAFIRGQLEVRAVLDPEEYNAEIGDLSRQYQDELLNSFSTAGGVRGYVQDVNERISETSQNYGAVNTEGIAERFTTIFPQYRGREDELARVIDTPEFAGIVNGIRATLAVGGDTAVDFIPIVGTLRQADELAEFWRNLSTEERLLGAGLLGLSVALEFVPGPEIRPGVRPRGGGPDVGTGRRGDVPSGGSVGPGAGNTAEFVRVLPDGSVEVPGGALSVSNVADPSFQMALLRGGAPSPSDLVRDVPNPIVLRPNATGFFGSNPQLGANDNSVVDTEGRPVNFTSEGIIIPRAVDNPGQVTATEENLGARGGSGAAGVVPGVGEGAGVGSNVGERTTTQTGVQAGVETTDVTATQTGVETAVGADVATGVGARTAVEPAIPTDTGVRADTDVEARVNAPTRILTATETAARTAEFTRRPPSDTPSNPRVRPPRSRREDEETVPLTPGQIPTVVGHREGVVERDFNFDTGRSRVGRDLHPEISNNPRISPRESFKIIETRRLTPAETERLRRGENLLGEYDGGLFSARVARDGRSVRFRKRSFRRGGGGGIAGYNRRVNSRLGR